MAKKRASDEMFIKGAIHTVASVGIEKLHTKAVADYTGFSEATLFRHFETREILLQSVFLYIDKELSEILTSSPCFSNPENTLLEADVFGVWHKLYRHLITNKDDTLFLIRYRYSSLYTDEVRKMREAYNGGFKKVYKVLENNLGENAGTYKEFIIGYTFDITLCFAEKVISGQISDSEETEHRIWTSITTAIKAITDQK